MGSGRLANGRDLSAKVRKFVAHIRVPGMRSRKFVPDITEVRP